MTDGAYVQMGAYDASSSMGKWSLFLAVNAKNYIQQPGKCSAASVLQALYGCNAASSVPGSTDSAKESNIYNYIGAPYDETVRNALKNRLIERKTMKKGSLVLSSIFLAFCFLTISISATEPLHFSFEESEVGFEKSGLSEEETKELFRAAENAAEMFSASGAYHPARYHLPDDGTGKPVPEGTPEKITVNGVSYLLISYGYNTEDRMLAYLETFFSEETAKEVFASEELGGKNQPRRYPVFIIRDGFLYETESKLAQNPSGEIKARCKRIVDEENRVVYHAETYLVSTIHFSQWERIPSSVSFDYVLEKQDGKWVFTSFKLPYYLALDSVTPISPATGDSTVFLLPAAALAFCGALLAAKKRKRVN